MHSGSVSVICVAETGSAVGAKGGGRLERQEASPGGRRANQKAIIGNSGAGRSPHGDD